MIIWHDRNQQVKKRTVKVGFVLLSYGKLLFPSAAEIFSTHSNISVSYADPTASAPKDNTMPSEGTGQFNAVHSLTTEIITTHTKFSTSHDYLA